MMKTTSAPPAKAGISRTGMSKAYDSRRKELKLRMKKMDEDLPDGSSICHVISRLRYKR